MDTYMDTFFAFNVNVARLHFIW